MITLTDNGHRVVKEAIILAHEITAETLACLKPPEQREVVRLLQKMI
jgi:DNA-binding MarR family transcriptional regulator